MRHGKLHGVAHNFVDSLAQGMSFVVPNLILRTHVFGEAAANDTGLLKADFLTGKVEGGRHEGEVEHALPLFKNAFPAFCENHSVDFSDYVEFVVHFITGNRGKAYIVTVRDRSGRRSSRAYVGKTGKRIKKNSELGEFYSKYFGEALD